MTETNYPEERKSIAVKNRDIPLLAQLIIIMRDIERLEALQQWQRDRMYNISQHITGMPGGKGKPRGIDDGMAALSDIDDQHGKKCLEYARQLKTVQRLINHIESRTMRAFVWLKYVMDTPDTEIRKKLNMSRRGFERARGCVESAPCMADVKWKERYIVDDGAE